jgi:hypothetical protein
VPEANDRLVICYNPDAAERDAAIRAELISNLGKPLPLLISQVMPVQVIIHPP